MASGPYYAGSQSSGDFHAWHSNNSPNNSHFQSSAFPNGISQPWPSGSQYIVASSSGHLSNPSQVYDPRAVINMEQLISSNQSTPFGFTQDPHSASRDGQPQNYYHSSPQHTRSISNSNHTPVSGPPSGNLWTNVRSNETPFPLDGPILPSANVFRHDQRAAMIPPGFPSTLPPYSINTLAPADPIYSSAVMQNSAPSSLSNNNTANPIWRRGRDESAIADRRKVDAQFECLHPVCIANFTTRGACKKHWESKHEGRRFHCIIEGCEREYADESSLGRHLRLNHGIHNKKDE